MIHPGTTFADAVRIGREAGRLIEAAQHEGRQLTSTEAVAQVERREVEQKGRQAQLKLQRKARV